jgi:hypothetical protein
VTQPLKVVQILMCRLLGVATVVLTTGVSGREDLFKKFTTFLAPMLQPESLYRSFSEGGHSGPIVQMRAQPPHIPDMGSPTCYRYERHRLRNTDGSTTVVLELVSYRPEGFDRLVAEPIIINVADIKPRHYEWLSEMLLKGACLVVNNTAGAIKRAVYLIKNLVRPEHFSKPSQIPLLQFALTIDEADDFIRTDMCRRALSNEPCPPTPRKPCLSSSCHLRPSGIWGHRGPTPTASSSSEPCDSSVSSVRSLSST